MKTKQTQSQKNNKKRLKKYNNITLNTFISKSAFSDSRGQWVTHKMKLTDADIEQLVWLFGGRSETKRKITSVLRYNLWRVSQTGLTSRVYLCKHSLRWRYCPGQDSVTEMRWMREHLLKYY